MFEGIIRNQIKKQMKLLKKYDIKLAFEEYQNEPVITASNLPSSYESVLSSVISALKKINISKEFDNAKNFLRFKNLPSQYLGLIKSCVDDYNSGRM